MKYSLTFTVKLLNKILTHNSFTFLQVLAPAHSSKCHSLRKEKPLKCCCSYKEKEAFFFFYLGLNAHATKMKFKNSELPPKLIDHRGKILTWIKSIYLLIEII